MSLYISTRGPGTPVSFTSALLSGLAPDGGLYIPLSWPRHDTAFYKQLTGKSYAAVAFELLRPFLANNEIDDKTLRALIDDTYSARTFGSDDVAPLREIGGRLWLLELFHGPTLSFKDYALQLLGRLFDHVLEKRGERLTIIGATSGDTGSAAIEACRSCRNIDIFILHPHERVSPVQRRQMTTVDSPNVFNLAIEGTFDDCQALVKTLFADSALRHDLNLSAVNSINWARIMAQTVYYTTAALQLGAPADAVSFAVPTGNFGNVYAAWAARHMGLNLKRLVVASNRNDILTRFFESGTMRTEKVIPSLSPSMDIQVSSNFERYLCELLGRDHKKTAALMKEFADTKSFSVEAPLLDDAHQDFDAQRCTDEQALATIRKLYEDTGIIIDPHTAVGLCAASHSAGAGPDEPMVVVSTAHPAKFPDAVEKATGRRPELPAALTSLMTRAEHFSVLPADAGTLKSFVRQRARRAAA